MNIRDELFPITLKEKLNGINHEYLLYDELFIMHNSTGVQEVVEICKNAFKINIPKETVRRLIASLRHHTVMIRLLHNEDRDDYAWCSPSKEYCSQNCYQTGTCVMRKEFEKRDKLRKG